jgi:hypothetical protein
MLSSQISVFTLCFLLFFNTHFVNCCLCSPSLLSLLPQALDRFKANPHGILVATDVAARGLDIPDVSLVLHYQLPASADVYIHRAGRTARTGAGGCQDVYGQMVYT